MYRYGKHLSLLIEILITCKNFPLVRVQIRNIARPAKWPMISLSLQTVKFFNLYEVLIDKYVIDVRHVWQVLNKKLIRR